MKTCECSTLRAYLLMGKIVNLMSYKNGEREATAERQFREDIKGSAVTGNKACMLNNPHNFKKKKKKDRDFVIHKVELR